MGVLHAVLGIRAVDADGAAPGGDGIVNGRGHARERDGGQGDGSYGDEAQHQRTADAPRRPCERVAALRGGGGVLRLEDHALERPYREERRIRDGKPARLAGDDVDPVVCREYLAQLGARHGRIHRIRPAVRLGDRVAALHNGVCCDGA